jgi:pilus assembly protein CpaF
MLNESGKRLDRSSPYVDFQIKDSSRVTAVIPPIAAAATSFVVRKKMRGNFSFQDLIKIGTLDERLFAFLKYCIIARMNILITGTTGTGKTTLLTLLIRELVPSYARIVVMEDTEEIVLSPDRHALKLLTRPSTTEGKYEVTLHDLVKLSLHMRPDRLVIGEIRGEEVFSLLQAVNTGHDGSMCTIHANNSQDAIARLEMLSLMARSNINIEVVRRFIKSGIDIIIHMNRYPGGRRLISQVSELSLDDNELVANDIFNLQRKIKDGKDDLHIQATGRVPFFMDRLKARTDIKDDFFKSN